MPKSLLWSSEGRLQAEPKTLVGVFPETKTLMNTKHKIKTRPHSPNIILFVKSFYVAATPVLMNTNESDSHLIRDDLMKINLMW